MHRLSGTEFDATTQMWYYIHNGRSSARRKGNKMTTFMDRRLAGSLMGWLASNGCVVSLVETAEGFEVHYTLKDDVKPQPPVKITKGRLIFPRGSQETVINSFFGSFK